MGREGWKFQVLQVHCGNKRRSRATKNERIREKVFGEFEKKAHTKRFGVFGGNMSVLKKEF